MPAKFKKAIDTTLIGLSNANCFMDDAHLSCGLLKKILDTSQKVPSQVRGHKIKDKFADIAIYQKIKLNGLSTSFYITK